MSGEPSPGPRADSSAAADGRRRDVASLPSDRRMAALITDLERLRRAQMSQMDLGTADLRILWMFSDGRARTLKQIAHDLELEQSTVNRQINAAIAEGLLERTREEGSPAQLISPSERGAAAFDGDVEKSLAALRSGLDAVDGDVTDFLDQFTRFVDAFDAGIRAADDG
ncbi:MarR family winged helix-turn-helix transcriptional regulator [Brevibacterium sp. LE-L]|uniref:MarR family winged helix-turn-helix transcriptional regulator n=1 Tax=Brevibacterium sp. LE-L TaxID=3418557 RepID=UPI003CF6121E